MEAHGCGPSKNLPKKKKNDQIILPQRGMCLACDYQIVSLLLNSPIQYFPSKISIITYDPFKENKILQYQNEI